MVGGVAGYTQAKHLMRTGAAGVLVGFGGGSAMTTRKGLGISAPMAPLLPMLLRPVRTIWTNPADDMFM